MFTWNPRFCRSTYVFSGNKAQASIGVSIGCRLWVCVSVPGGNVVGYIHVMSFCAHLYSCANSRAENQAPGAAWWLCGMCTSRCHLPVTKGSVANKFPCSWRSVSVGTSLDPKGGRGQLVSLIFQATSMSSKASSLSHPGNKDGTPNDTWNTETLVVYP